MSLSSPHSQWQWNGLGPRTLTLARGPRPSGAEASRAGTVEGARCVVTAAWPAGRWLLGTLIHIFFTRRAPEASRANTAERAGQVLTDPSATKSWALRALVHICPGQGASQSHPTPTICSASLTSNTFTFPSPSFCLPVPSLRLLVCLILPPLLCYSNSPSSIPLPSQSLSFRSPS